MVLAKSQPLLGLPLLKCTTSAKLQEVPAAPMLVFELRLVRQPLGTLEHANTKTAFVTWILLDPAENCMPCWRSQQCALSVPLLQMMSCMASKGRAASEL